jgi:hypothetical protein
VGEGGVGVGVVVMWLGLASSAFERSFTCALLFHGAEGRSKAGCGCIGPGRVRAAMSHRPLSLLPASPRHRYRMRTSSRTHFTHIQEVAGRCLMPDD